MEIEELLEELRNKRPVWVLAGHSWISSIELGISDAMLKHGLFKKPNKDEIQRFDDATEELKKR